jgi:uncharacterized protein YciW
MVQKYFVKSVAHLVGTTQTINTAMQLAIAGTTEPQPEQPMSENQKLREALQYVRQILTKPIRIDSHTISCVVAKCDEALIKGENHDTNT